MAEWFVCNIPAIPTSLFIKEVSVSEKVIIKTREQRVERLTRPLKQFTLTAGISSSGACHVGRRDGDREVSPDPVRHAQVLSLNKEPHSQEPFKPGPFTQSESIFKVESPTLRWEGEFKTLFHYFKLCYKWPTPRGETLTPRTSEKTYKSHRKTSRPSGY